MAYNCRSICCSFSFIHRLMFLHTLFSWVSPYSLCGSHYSKRSRHAAHYLISSFRTISWASSWAVCTRLSSSLPLGSSALCQAVPLQGYPSCSAQTFTPSPCARPEDCGSPTWCGCLPCSVSSSDFRTALFRKGKEEEGTP